ncbi:hypothetical protein QBC34DRAFT_399546 [Podospora aff. communis PSN243]|uniref:Uncharacterized protein n=1 Tax=Podospora aff. communis PSN243 TaxID=3040156 RepID=A0AAV9GSG0_9PEZI|nr:hypothetical protein QBC34DRAFT_399546 [Podospora aff. communis PSN243]
MSNPSPSPTIPAPSPSEPPNTPSAFQRFDSYPWSRDRQFIQGLLAMLGPLSNSFERRKALGVTLQARIWWYASGQSITIDRSAYETYTSSHPSSTDAELLDKVEEIQKRMGIVDEDDKGGLPEWMVSAPQKVDLNRKAEDGEEGERAKREEGTPYPAHFQAIIDAVTTGKAVAGVREIPNTVVRQAGISPRGKMQAPRKPWERQQQQLSEEISSLPGQGTTLNESFPPVGEDSGNAEP